MDKKKHTLLFIFVMVLLCTFNCNGLKNVNNFQKFLSVVDDKKLGIVLLQDTFWDDNYIDSVKH